MTIRIWSCCAAALALGLAPAAWAAEGDKPAQAPRVYGPQPAPVHAPRVYGPQPAPGAAAQQSIAKPVMSSPEVTVKVAARAESRKAGGKTQEAGVIPPGDDHGDARKAGARLRTVTIYFVHGEEKQSTLEFTLPETDVKTAMAFEAKQTEADVHDGKLLLRGDVHLKFGNGLRLEAQLVTITVGRNEGPMEIVVKE